MTSGTYRENRARISTAELSKHQGRWVAFSLDGSTIIASCEDLAALDNRLLATGIDPEQVALERIELGAGDVCLGGAELQ